MSGITGDARLGLAQAAAWPYPPAPRSAEHSPPSWHDSDAGALGQAIAHRLFSAGLDLHSALSLISDGPAAGRLDRAIAELDEAIKDLRHMMLAMLAPVPPAPLDAALCDGDIRSIRRG